jgi:hypothetical protein
MKHAANLITKSPTAFVIIMLLFLLVLLFTVGAISKGRKMVNNIEKGETITQVVHVKSH